MKRHPSFPNYYAMLIERLDGDTITLEGMACSYAGVQIENAQVRYRVKRAMAWWWRFMSRYWGVGGYYGEYEEDDYYEGVAQTDENGRFLVDVPLKLVDDDEVDDLSTPLFMDIIVEADVIDSTGEMQSAKKYLPLSNKEYIMHIQMREKIECSEEHTFTSVIKNALGQNLDKEVEYWFDESATHACVMSNLPVQFSGLEIGKHVLHVKYDGEEQTQEFVLFDKDATKTPYATEKWAYQSAEVFPENGGEVILQIGCSEENTYLIYNIFSGNKIIESGAEMVESGMMNRRFSYESRYGNGIVVSYAWVRNQTLQTHQFTITKPIPKHELVLSWKTFRDKVVPSASEKWILTVKDKEGRNVTANVIAALYDKSLDQLVENSWKNFGPVLKWNVPSAGWEGESVNQLCLSIKWSIKEIETPYRFNVFKYLSQSHELLKRQIMVSNYCKSCYAMTPGGLAGGSADYLSADFSFGDEVDEEGPESSYDERPVQEIKLRSDMSETAFFMPMLRTDSNGEVYMEFTLPDSLTTWKFQAIAHSRDMYHAYLEDETVARKLVMVKPNMPRFVRVGDETTIAAKVTNASGKVIDGKIVFELLSAEDEHIVFSASKLFTLADNSSSTESFQFTPDEEIEEYICRIYAVGEGFSDGEQHALRVLPNKTEVTVTNVISQDGAGRATVNTAMLLPEGSTRRKLSMQYTNKPLWMAVKALPALSDENGKDAISVAVSLYCHILTAHLQKHVKSFGTVLSADPKKLEKTTDKLITKLGSLQGSGGGFTWFKGMPESLFMTTEVLMHLCRLQLFTGKIVRLEHVIDKAFRFCDKEMCHEVSELKKDEKKGRKVFMPSYTILQHMYNCAISKRTLKDGEKEAYEYLIGLVLKDIHRQTIREKAMSAVILDYSGCHERAMSYAESLRQYTKCDGDRGRTFDTPRASYSWCSYKIPTHVAGMEVLNLLCPEDKLTFREMQKWLLRQKRTQMWETPIDSVNAVHALLIDSDEYLADNRLAELYADGKRIEVESKGNEGYVETELPASNQELSIEKSSKGLSWGAVYARFLQPMSDVEASGSGMTIKREIITDKKELHVGDRIRVRLTYTCERNFDLVTVIDSKAACMEPVEQLSWSDSFKSVEPRDTEIRYSYYGLAEGSHSIETEYYLDRPGVYEVGVATIVCTYAPEFRATCPSQKLVVLK